jgi:hypothetical protein
MRYSCWSLTAGIDMVVMLAAPLSQLPNNNNNNINEIDIN